MTSMRIVQRFVRTARVWPLLLAALSQTASAGPPPLTYADLCRRLTDLSLLATLPQPGERTLLSSSTDRNSHYDAATNSYVNWSANGDAYGAVRMEGDDLVMMDVSGPGCIWRIWTAEAKMGHVRVYLDGAAEPAIDLPFSAYFDGEHAPFTRKNLVYTAGRGCNNYTPIPFARSCKIVASKGWGQYYHLTYSAFAPGAPVPTFSVSLDPQALRALDEADASLGQCGKDPYGSKTGQTESKTVNVPPGQVVTFCDLQGPGAITALRIRVPESRRNDAMLRALTLAMRWDGEDAPSVWTPLADFFGSAPGANPFRSYPVGFNDDGWWYSYWYMPFESGAALRLGNDSAEAVDVETEVCHDTLFKPIDRLGRFHAKWHGDAFLPTARGREGDWTLLTTVGSGRLAGILLNVWNPRGHWWGEGDEKFFVDGETFPSLFGTGSEDYFGFAWGDWTEFSRPFHGQTRLDGNLGHSSMYRWHIADSVPFQQSFEGSIEKYFPNERPTLYTAVAYWYQKPGGQDPYSAVPLSDRVHWPAAPLAKKRVILEGEGLQVAEMTGGRTHAYTLGGYYYSWPRDEACLRWEDAKPGDRLGLILPIDEPGRYVLTLYLVKAYDMGQVQILFDGEKTGTPVDLYDWQIQPARPIDLGERTLDAGVHTLQFQVTGRNPEAAPRYAVGIDYVIVEKVPGP